ncbi:hypothetical protein FNF28_01518 [Cafeteria roenbergensis]|nr:hypothetical protein FNF28_01518 [Cafeteria roenbergensis]
MAVTPLLPDHEHFVSEADALDTLAAALAKIEGVEDAGKAGLDKKTGATELEFAMGRGWWELSKQLVSAYRARKVDLTAPVYNTASRIKKQIQHLQESLQAQKATRIISPAFRWAQSPSAVFLEQKFSHKWDAPATLGCKQDRFSVKNRRISFHAACKDKRKRFHLDIDLFRPLDATLSSVTFNSVGRATLTLRKSTNATWPRLFRRGDAKPSNVHTWHAMSERYAAELKDFAEVEANLSKSADPKAPQADNSTEVSPKQEEAQAPPAEPPVGASATAVPEADAVAEPAVEDPASLAAAKQLGQEEINALEAAWRTAREKILEINARARAEKALVQSAAEARAAAIRAEFAAKRAQAA